MKAIAVLFTWVVIVAGSYAEGIVNFANTSATLISVNGVPMPPRTVQEYVFAVFLAPAGTVSVPGQTPSFTDPVFQLASGYTTNTSSAAVGRLTSRLGLDVGSIGGYSPGQTVDFVVRGWSSNMGYTWSEALANWNNGSPLMPNWAMGSSTIGNDLILGGGPIPSTTLFGIGVNQIGGFHLIPEPSSLALVGLGALVFRKMGRRDVFR